MHLMNDLMSYDCAEYMLENMLIVQKIQLIRYADISHLKIAFFSCRFAVQCKNTH